MIRDILRKAGVVVLACVCCLMLCMCAQPAEDQNTNATENTENIVATQPVYDKNTLIYWNVDREQYCAQSESILSRRKTNADKKYEVRFAVDGKQTVLNAATSDLVTRIDFQYAVGLVLDANGEIEDVKTISQCGLEIAANWSYVISVNGSVATCNTAASGKGTEFKLDTKDCGVYDVSAADNTCGQATQLRKGDQLYALRTKEGTLTHVFVTQRNDLSVNVQHEAHCVCGGTGAHNHTCAQQTEWIAWGDDLNELDKLPTASGCYYLVKDVMLPARHTFPEGAEITICLNGKNIGGKNRLFGVYSKLNFCDCQYTETEGAFSYKGTVKMSYSANNASGGAFYVYDGCEINVYGGNYVATGYISNGGLVQTRLGGTFNLYNGVLRSENAVINKGGIINMMDGGTLNLYGGEITGGDAGLGGGICSQKGTITASGDVKIRDNKGSNLYLCEGMVLQLSGLAEDAMIGITVADPSVPFAEGAEEADAQRFVSDVSGYKVVWNSETKQLSLVAE